MIKRLLLYIMLAGGALLAPAAAEAADIIPLPAQVTESGKWLKLSPEVAVTVDASDSARLIAARCADALSEATGVRFAPGKKGSRKSKELVLKASSDLGPEAYSLEITPKGITVEASTPAGFFYGLQTLRQIALTCGTRGKLPCMSVTDAPRFGWRGFMLDEGRHFFGKEEVKKILDLMAFYKMNRFHWHLTEDQGWRIEIKKWPKLTATGATRGSKSLGTHEVAPDSLTYSGHYTQDDIREIVGYARDRFIEIVPEIDIPGHTQAAVAAYPEILACDPDSAHQVWRYQGVSTDVVNVANPGAVRMTEDIIDEVVSLFPFHYLHLGGDECPTQKWEQNQQCIDRLAELGSDNFRDLQLDYYQTLSDHLASSPRGGDTRLIFWNEVLHGNPDLMPANSTIMSWIDADREGIVAAERGHDVIMTPQIPYYINRKQATGDGEPMSQGHGTETVERVYSYDPLATVDPALAARYLGVQANFWTEWVETADVLEYLMMPRLAAVAEAAWTPQPLRSYTGFAGRMAAHRPILESRGWNYARHMFDDTPPNTQQPETNNKPIDK